MIIREWDDNLVVTDNVLTNMPISKLSSITTAVNGMRHDNLLLISKPCDPPEMTDTGYMSYYATFDDMAGWMYGALSIGDITSDIEALCGDVALLNPYLEMLQNIKAHSPVCAHVDIYDSAGRFDPAVISGISAIDGVLISTLGTYNFSDAMANIFNWKMFNKISASNGYFTNAKITSLTSTTATVTNLTATNANITNSLTVKGEPYKFIKVMRQSTYDAIATKDANTVYLTYP